MMTRSGLEDVYKLIRNERPGVIYVGGRTCTGKSTLAKTLNARHGYATIDLDVALEESVLVPFNVSDRERAFSEVFRERREHHWIAQFVSHVRAQITANQESKQLALIDGAVGNVDTLAEIIDGYHEIQFVFLHPIDLDEYIARLTARLLTVTPGSRGRMPVEFWNSLSQNDIEKFLITRQVGVSIASAIAEYSLFSRAESENRLALFEERFEHVISVDV